MCGSGQFREPGAAAEKPTEQLVDVSDVGIGFSLASVLPFIIIEFLSSSVLVVVAQGSAANSSGSLCWWCGESGSGQEEIVLLHGRATLLCVCVC